METSRAEAERLVGIAEKLLRNKDYAGCRDFAILAQETEPLLEGTDQVLAVAEVLLASENTRQTNNQPEWYSILQIPPRTAESDLIKKQYRRLALLLHPDKNKFPSSESAFRLVADSWALLSDPDKKSAYDAELASRFAKVDLAAIKKQQQQNKQAAAAAAAADSYHPKLPVRRNSTGDAFGSSPYKNAAAGMNANKRSISENPNWRVVGSIWTACPYCYNLYEYPRVYEDCCLRCDNVNCKRAFTATPILSMPPLVPGSEAYYCCWGFFPMGFAGKDAAKGNGFPQWMPPMFDEGGVPNSEFAPAQENVTPAARVAAPAPAGATSSVKKRDRPKKNVF